MIPIFTNARRPFHSPQSADQIGAADDELEGGRPNCSVVSTPLMCCERETSISQVIPETRITDNRRFFAGQNKKVVIGSANIDDPYPTNARIVSGGAADGKYSIECEATTPESLVQQHVAGDIALLKMDIEGSKYDVLYSTTDATLKRIKRMAIETEDLDNDRRYAEALSSFRRGKGFDVIEVTPHLLHAGKFE